MKVSIAFLIGFVLGCVIYNFRDESFITTYQKSGWHVVLTFQNSGKNFALSDSFKDQEECLNSKEYYIQKIAAKESGSNVNCSNIVDYK